MTGMAALAISAAFTSCSKDTDVYNSGVIENNNKQSIVNSYNEAFVKTFGQPAANHNWGFVNYAKSSTRTTINVNGNEEKYENAPSLKDNEEIEIRDYVRQLTTTPHVAPTGLKNYFVTQVHDGEEYYTNADGGAGILGSSKMNHLQIAMQQGGVIEDGNLSSAGNWMHINNFNKGDNTDWNGNTLVEDGGTFNFAYHGTEDSQYHDRWISVKGEDVDAYYNNLGTYSGAKYAGYYYICFDFEATIGGPTKVSNIEYYDPETQSWQNSSTIDIPGIYTKEQIESLTLDLEVAIPAELHYDSSIPNQWGGYGVNVVDRWVYVNLSNSEQVRKATFSNVLDGNQFIAGNDIYDDWIVRLVEATPKDDNTIEIEEPEYSLRVICEDLNAQAGEGDPEDSDWDFNDLVFDVKFLGSNQVQIQVVAVGGTLPIRINGEDALEAHGLYDKGTNIMINTGAGAKYPSQAYESNGIIPEKAIFTRTIAGVDDSYGKNIKVEVKKGNDWIELTADADQPAAKIGVEPTFDYCTERVDISGRYTNFISWIRTKNPARWWNE